MERLYTFGPWLNRLTLLAVTIVFARMGIRFSLDPAGAAAPFGISLVSPLAVSMIRITFGAIPIGCAIIFAACLISKRRLVTGSVLLLSIVGAAATVRVLSFSVDGVLPTSLQFLYREAIILSLSALGLLLGSRRGHEIEHSPH